MDVFFIKSIGIESIECIRDPCPVLTVSTYIVLMVWLKSPQSQLSKTFCGLKIGWIFRKLWAETCECVLYRGARGHFIQSRVEFSHLMVLCIRCCVRVINTSVSTVSTNITFNALHALIFVLTVLTNKIPYTILNSIALILCIECLNMSFNADKVTMITVSGFLTI